MLERKLTEALQAARPQPPADFDRRSDGQLLRLRMEGKQVKKVSGLVIALALVLALGMTAAVAAGWWGIADFLNNDDLGGLTRPSGVTGETAHASFTVTESIYDGRGVYLAVAVRPKEPHTLLLPAGTPVDAQAAHLVSGFEGTLADYAQAQGCERIVWAAAEAAQGGEVQLRFAQRAHLEPDGTLMLLLSATGEDFPDALPLTLACATDTRDWDTPVWQEVAAASHAALSLELTRDASAERSFVSAAPVVFDQLGLTVDRLRLTVTPLATYYEIDYTAHDPAANRRDDSRTPGFVFQFLREDGKSYPAGGVARISRYVLLDEAAGRGQWRGTLDPLAEAPAAIGLKAIHGTWAAWDAAQTLSIPLAPAD